MCFVLLKIEHNKMKQITNINNFGTFFTQNYSYFGCRGNFFIFFSRPCAKVGLYSGRLILGSAYTRVYTVIKMQNLKPTEDCHAGSVMVWQPTKTSLKFPFGVLFCEEPFERSGALCTAKTTSIQCTNFGSYASKQN